MDVGEGEKDGKRGAVQDQELKEEEKVVGGQLEEMFK